MLDATIILKLLKTNVQQQHNKNAWQASGSHSYSMLEIGCHATK